MVMVRFLASLLLATVLLAVAQLSIAAAAAPLSGVEKFWATVLPDYPLPEALHWYLHPDNNSKSTVEGAGAGDDASSSDSADIAQRLSRQWPALAADDIVERLSRQWPYFYSLLHECSSSDWTYGKQRSPSSPHQSATRSFGDDEAHSHVLAGGDGAKMNMSAVFFHEEAVQVGRSLPFYFPPARRAPMGMLPRNVADSLPFSSQVLLDILAWLGVAAGSAEAGDMQKTLRLCETPSPIEEPKFCATSLETQIEGARTVLGGDAIRPLTSMLPRFGAPWQPYVIRAVHPEVGSRFVSCHDVVYLYTVYRCHGTGPARLYKVEMEGGRGGGIVDVAVICHTDTSQWYPEHLAFKLLGTKPGGPPVCHVMPYGHIAWASNGGAAHPN